MRREGREKYKFEIDKEKVNQIAFFLIELHLSEGWKNNFKSW